ncbi:hypothetical protein EHQ58_12155 [Leptospira ognonensis]|uniref:Uncharacterized protein n=1 Tax=Leptospira ognonensis TaxID=2484945 RepID=A0A4R9JZK5_9LEPT|nr:hypothetical protein [Leptospira ognonensis]TGL58129.1 hypothetical protein EHQ58_12155 [Leptospira ognonensis]
MFRYTILFFCVLVSTGLSAISIEEELKNKCQFEDDQPLPKDKYSRLIHKMEFEKARDFCDTQPKDKKNCKASARFWLGAREFANREDETAETYFLEGLEFKSANGKVVDWIHNKGNHTGWGNPEDMLRYVQKSKTLDSKEPKYIQTLTYVIVANTETEKLQKRMDPCLALHGLLSLKVLKRYIELFSENQLTIEIKMINVTQTATRLNERNYIMLSGLAPWDENLSLQMNQIATESDLVFIAFPRFGGNANANYGSFPIVPKFANSPFRTYIKMPSEWLTMINFPQIFHEYMHTVEFHMNRNGDKKFHATSHGSDGKRVEEITGLPTSSTGETDWAEHLFANRIRELAISLELSKQKNGWEQIFGIHLQNKNLYSETQIKELYKKYKGMPSTEGHLPNTEDSN